MSSESRDRGGSLHLAATRGVSGSVHSGQRARLRLSTARFRASISVSCETGITSPEVRKYALCVLQKAETGVDRIGSPRRHVVLDVG